MSELLGTDNGISDQTASPGVNITPLPNGDIGNPYPPVLGMNFVTNPSTVVAGQPSTLIIEPYFARNHYAVPDGDLALINGYRIHLHIVSEDLSVFSYLLYENMYASLADAFNDNTAHGRYLFPFTFPKGGKYSLTIYYRVHYNDSYSYNNDVHPFGNAQVFLTVADAAGSASSSGAPVDVSALMRQADYAAEKVFSTLPLDPYNPNNYTSPIIVNASATIDPNYAFSAHAQISDNGLDWWDINAVNANNETLQNNTCYVVRVTYYMDTAYSTPRNDLGTFVEAPMQFYIIKDDLSVWNNSWADQLRSDNQVMLYMPLCLTYLPTPVYHSPENGDEGGVANGVTLGPFKVPFGPTVVFDMYFPSDGIYRLYGQTTASQGSQLLATSWTFRVGMGPVPPDPTPAPTPAPATPGSHVATSAAAARPAVLPFGSAILVVLALGLLFQ